MNIQPRRALLFGLIFRLCYESPKALNLSPRLGVGDLLSFLLCLFQTEYLTRSYQFIANVPCTNDVRLPS